MAKPLYYIIGINYVCPVLHLRLNLPPLTDSIIGMAFSECCLFLASTPRCGQPYPATHGYTAGTNYGHDLFPRVAILNHSELPELNLTNPPIIFTPSHINTTETTACSPYQTLHSKTLQNPRSQASQRA
jgi:hypothetical protein